MIKLIFFIFCLTALFSIKENKNNKKYLLIVLLLILFAAFRDGNAVRDYNSYIVIYKNTSISLKEMSFSLIAWLTKHIFFDNVIFLFIIYAIIGVGLKTYAIKELTTLYFLSLVIYISNFYILHELTQIRVGVATGFLLLCIKPLYERNLQKFIILASFAVFFHYSVLPIYFLWFLRSDRINKYIYAIIIPLSYIFYFSHFNLIELLIKLIPITYIQQKYIIYKEAQLYAADGNKINVFNYLFLIKCLIFYILLWRYNYIKIKNKYIILLLKIEALSLASFIIFSTMPMFAFRINELLGVV